MPTVARGAVVDADLMQVPVGAGAVHVERYGLGGPPIVLLHGFGTSAFLWRNVAPELARRGCLVYAVDLMGYGESDRPFEADYSLANQVEVLRAALGALRLRRAAIAGVDLGAGVALRLAAMEPEMVSHLALINSAATWSWPGDDVRRVQGRTAHNALRLARGILGASALLGPVLRESVADPGHMPPRLVARYLAPFAGTEGVVHLLELARALDSADLAEVQLGAISAKTLIVHGAADRWLPLASSARLHSGIAGSGLVTVPNAARLVPEDVPVFTAELLLALLEVEHSGAMQALWNDS